VPKYANHAKLKINAIHATQILTEKVKTAIALKDILKEKDKNVKSV
jgi:hypothetical protein